MNQPDRQSSETNAQTSHITQDGPYEKKHYSLLLLTLLFGILFDTLFHGGNIGISIPICVLSFYGIMIWNERRTLQLRLDFGWFLFLPVILLSMTYALFSNSVLSFFNLPALLVLVVL